MATGLAVGGLVLGAAGTLMSYSGQKKASEKEAAAAEFEAALHEQEAKFAEYEKQIALKQHAIATRELRGAQLATMAGQGFRVGSGSNRRIIEHTSDLADWDAALIRWKGNVNVWREQQIAKQLREVGATAGTLGSLRATGTLLSGGASFLSQASDIYRMSKQDNLSTKTP